MYIYGKSNTIMSQYTEPKTIKFTKSQIQTLEKLKIEYQVNISWFIRIAIAEKIKKDYVKLARRKNNFDLPNWLFDEHEI